MRFSVFAPLAALCLLLADAAFPATIDSRLPELKGEIDSRIAVYTGPVPLSKVEKKRKAALLKAAKRLAVDTDDVAKAIPQARTAVAALDSVYVDSTMVGLLDGVVTYLQSTVNLRLAAMDQTAGALADGKLKTAFVKAKNAASTAMSGFAAATTRAARITVLGKALASVVKGENAVVKAGATVCAIERFDALVEGKPVRVPQLGGYAYGASYVSVGTPRFNVIVQATAGAVRHSMALTVTDPGAGEHAVATGPMTNYSGTPGTGLLPSTSGTVTFTTWDPGNQKAAGTFTATFSDGTTTVHVTKGTFSTIRMQGM